MGRNRIKNRFEILDDLQYYTTVDYDEELINNDDHDPYHGNDSYIVNARIRSVKLNAIFKNLVLKNDTPAEIYCIDRIIRILRIDDTDIYNIDTFMGYYGDEIDKVTLNSDINSKLKDNITHMLSLKDCTEKINYVLELEYGYILDNLKNLTFKLEKIKYKDIMIPNTTYTSRISHRLVDFYKEHTLPIGITRFSAGRHILVDGYHRYHANKNKRIVEVFCGR